MADLRFFFDPGSGAVLWRGTSGRIEDVGPVELQRLPITADLCAELDRLAGWYDTSMNWDYPPDPGPWDEAECAAFNHAVRDVVARLRQELGPGWSIDDQFTELRAGV